MATSASCARSCPIVSRSISRSRSAARGVVSGPTVDTLRRMKGLRNILVHEYGRVNDALVFETIQTRLDDFVTFKREILVFLRTP
jgi:uncharacterized protein YutE (UPF0331/DUF86 family)